MDLEKAFDKALYCCFFNLSFLINSLVLFYRFGDMSSLASYILGGFSVFYTLSIFILFTIFFDYSERFRKSFKNLTFSEKYFVIHILLFISSVLLATLLEEISWCPLIPQGILLLLAIIKRPYKRGYDNIRLICNNLFLCAITSMNVYYFYVVEEKNSNFYYPLVFCIFLLLGALFSFIVLRDVVKEIKKKYGSRLAF